MRNIPSATYRIQLHRGFTFSQARSIVPYLAKLGIGALYASPMFMAAPGSTHGYDVCDHNRLNPELGTEEEFKALCDDLKSHGMGFIADFVPNHMGIERAINPWWRSVLEHGPSSPYARYFDIDWQPLKSGLQNKVLLPELGQQYGRILEDGGFSIEFSNGEFSLRHGELCLPMDPCTTVGLLREAAGEMADSVPAELESIITAIEHLPSRTDLDPKNTTERARETNIIRERLTRLCEEKPEAATAIARALDHFQNPSDPDCFDRMDALIDAQAYRLSFWQVAGEEINYRRFFDVNTLAAVRVELPEVFEEIHRLVLDLLNKGMITGIRVDHIDGLADPLGYLQRLREEGGPDFYLVVEKILASDERLRRQWPVDGTTGYEFAIQMTQLLLNPEGVPTLATAYDKWLGYHSDFSDVVYRSKKLVMQTSMASEINVLGDLLNRISESHRWYRDFTANSLTTAVRELIACFPVYRTYLDPEQIPDEEDVRIIDRALRMTRRRNPASERTVLAFLRDVLLPPSENSHPVDEELRRLFVRKFQQCTGPIAAKGVEDTALYVFNRHVALNEVGGDPHLPAMSVETFHRLNAERQHSWPHCMLTTSTHDTKRSEDVRARLAALTEIADDWSRSIRRWQTLNRKHHEVIDGESVPDHNEEYQIYQALVGAWPAEGLHQGNASEFTRRIQEYMVKALHEAKVNSSWLSPNAAWDEAVCRFVQAIMEPSTRNRFLPSLAEFAGRLSELGAINSLTQTILKLTCPGVPDLYQGTESWDFSLVDPDNRRPVDYERRMEDLAAIAEPDPAQLLADWRSGRIKMFLINRLLELRAKWGDVFSNGDYRPLESRGEHADKIIAFSRQYEGKVVVVIAPRLTSTLGFPPVGGVWQDSKVSLPVVEAGWRDILTGRTAEANQVLDLKEALGVLPFTILCNTTAL